VLFNSIEFLALMLAVLATMTMLRRRGRRGALLAASLVFYASWNPTYIALLMVLIVGNYSLGRWVQSASTLARGRLRWVAALFNLGLLAGFKYAGFLVVTATPLLDLLGLTPSAAALDIVLPLAISFITFQGLAYVIDVSRGGTAATSLGEMALFLSFFPQLIAGPIVRGHELLPQLHDAGDPDRLPWSRGVLLIALGMTKKCLFADHLALFVDRIWASGATGVGWLDLMAAYAYAFQLYLDFSAYTDIGRGCAHLLGIELPENFKKPYMALGIRDFWRRWHITLSQWLRDYLYIPLGGGRGSALRTRANLLITMLLGGLWHGAAWGFVLWGAFHGILLIIERPLAAVGARFGIAQTALGRGLLRLLTFHLVVIGWVLFRLVDLDACITALVAIATMSGGIDQTAVLSTLWIPAFAIIYMVASHRREQLLALKLHPIAAVCCAVAIGFLVGYGPYQQSFIYFQF
jgi:alginate O-acetyltransferase complex protein AlgI